jgi:hypothetical protein
MIQVRSRSMQLFQFYNSLPEWVFCTGAVSMGVFALINGFIRNKIPLLVVRALTGAGLLDILESNSNLI